MPTYCPACGYDLALPDPDLHPELCPCCAFDFKELDDYLKTHHDSYKYQGIFIRTHRRIWAEAHLPWHSRTVPRPDGWEPIHQLRNIGEDWGNSYEEWMEQHPVIIPENKEKFLRIVRERLQKLDWRPEFVEALWDGDTQGWFLDVWVSAKRPDGQYHMVSLLRLRGAGGDMRAFNGMVPPYPEAAVGGFVMEEIAKEFNIPSYFPAPDLPDDSFARYWERDQSERCPDCGRHITHGYGSRCRACHEQHEQTKKL